MKNTVLVKIEEVIGKVKAAVILDEQGCTSVVRRIVTEEKYYILKSAIQERYRLWLKEEAKVLEMLQEDLIPIPKYHGFFDELDSSHLLMSLEDGITLTAALKSYAIGKETVASEFWAIP